MTQTPAQDESFCELRRLVGCAYDTFDAAANTEHTLDHVIARVLVDGKADTFLRLPDGTPFTVANIEPIATQAIQHASTVSAPGYVFDSVTAYLLETYGVRG